jgi:hypothetical protein
VYREMYLVGANVEVYHLHIRSHQPGNVLAGETDSDRAKDILAEGGTLWPTFTINIMRDHSVSLSVAYDECGAVRLAECVDVAAEVEKCCYCRT